MFKHLLSIFSFVFQLFRYLFTSLGISVFGVKLMKLLPEYELNEISLKDLFFATIFVVAIQVGILFREWLRHLAEMDSKTSWEYFWELARKLLPNKKDDWF